MPAAGDGLREQGARSTTTDDPRTANAERPGKEYKYLYNGRSNGKPKEDRQMLVWLIGGAVAAGTYVFAKRKKATTGQSAIAATATGSAAAGAAALLSVVWPIVLLGGLAGGVYYFGKRRDQKALPPAEG